MKICRAMVGDVRPSRSGLGMGLEGICLALPLTFASLLAIKVEGLTTGNPRGETRFLAEDGCDPLVAGFDDLGS